MLRSCEISRAGRSRRRKRALRLGLPCAAGPAFSRGGSDAPVRLACFGRAAACLLTFALALLLTAEAAWAQTDTTLVSNTGQAVHQGASVGVGNIEGINYGLALAFTTGDYAPGYRLSGVDVRILSTNGSPTFVVSVYNTESGSPTTSLHVLENPASLSTGTFTAPAGARLLPNTTYALVFEVTSAGASDQVRFSLTASDSEDAGGASGWSIANAGRGREDDGAWSGLNLASIPFIAIKGRLSREPPAFSSAWVSGTDLRVTFDRSLDADSASASSAFTVSATPESGAARTINGASAAVTIDGATASVTLAESVAEGEAVTVSYAKPASKPLQDASGNEVLDFSGQPVFNATGDTDPPRRVSTTVNGQTVTVTFDEDLDTSVTVGASRFRHRIGSGALQFATGVSVSRRTVTLTFATAARHGQTVTVLYSIVADSAQNIRDLSGNLVPPTHINAGWAVTNNTPPAFSSAAVNGDRLTITFEGPLDEGAGSKPAGGDFAVTVDGGAASLADTAPVVSGDTVTLALAEAVLRVNAVTVAYTPGTNRLKDADGAMHEVPGFSGKAVTNDTPADTDRPGLASSSINGAVLTVVFDEELDATGTSNSFGFSALVADASAFASSASISGSTVTVNLDQTARHGQAAWVWYNRPGAVGERLKDLSGNEALNIVREPVTNNTPPQFSSASVNASTLTITFDGGLDEAAGSKPAGTDFAVTVNGSAVSLAEADPVAVSDTTVTLALAEAVLRIDTLTVGYTPGTNRLKDTDGAMHEVPGFSAQAVTNDTPADTTRPTVTSAAVNGAALTITFDEPLDESSVPLVAAFNISVAGAAGNPDQVSGIDGRTVTMTLNTGHQNAHGQEVRIWYTPPSDAARRLKDRSGNEVDQFFGQAVTNNTPPAYSSSSVNGDELTITFDGGLDEDAGSKPAGTDFAVTVNGSAVSLTETTPVAVSDTTVTLALAEAVLRIDTLTVGYTPGTNRLKDADGAMHEVPGFSAQAVTNDTPADTTRPTVTSAAVNGTALTITFDEPLDESSVPLVAAFNISVAGAAGNPDQVSGIDGRTVTMTLNTGHQNAHGQEVRIWYTPPSDAARRLKDRSGNEVDQFFGQAVTNNTPPAYSSSSVNGDELTITFDGGLDEDAGSKPAGTDFAVTVNGSAVSLTETTPVAVSDTTVTLALAEAVLRIDTLTVGYTPGTNRLKDADGAMHEVPGFSAQAVTNDTPADTTRPTVTSAAVNGTALTITFDEPLDESSVPLVAAFNISVAGAAGNPDQVSGIDGRTVTMTLNTGHQNAHGQEVRIWYTPPSDAARRLKDRSGNEVDQFFGQAVTNNTPPVFSSAAVNASTLTITFDGGLDEASGSQPADTDFAVTVNGSAVSLAETTPVEVSDTTVTLALAEAVLRVNAVTVGYTPGTNTLKDADNAMEEVPGFSGKAVTNDTPADTDRPGLASSSINGAVLTVVFDEELDATGTSNSFGFSALVADASAFASSASISGSTVTVNLDQTARHGQAVWVWYNRPGAVGERLKDLTGNEALNIVRESVTNNTPPAFSSAAVDGSTLTITFDGGLDEAAGSRPAGNDFAVTVGGSAVSLAETDPVEVTDTTVTLALAEAVLRIDTLTVGYTPGTNKLKDADGPMHEVPGFTAQAVTNDTPADTDRPQFESAAVNGTALTITFNEALDETVTLAGDQFRVNLDNVGQIPSGASVSGSEVTVTLPTAARHGQVVLLWYVQSNDAAKRLKDLSGNLLDPDEVKQRPVTNNTPPAFSSAAVDGSTLTITFDGRLDEAAGSKPTGTDFAVTVAGNTADLAETDPVEVSDTTVTLALAEAVLRVQAVTVGYTPGTNRLKDADNAMEEVPGFSGKAVTNDTPADTNRPGLASSSINGAVLTVVFDEELDATGTSNSFGFSALVADASAFASSASISGSTVTVNLDQTARHGQAAWVWYNRPGAVGERLKDLTGNEALNIVREPVTNNTPPAFSSAAVDGSTLTITFSGGLDAGSVPGTSAFTVKGIGADQTPTGVAISDATVSLTLARRAMGGETVQVSYAKPDANPVRDADNAKNPVPAFTDRSVTNAPSDRPVISLVRIVSQPTHDADGDGRDDTYIQNDTILVDVEFSSPVVVTGGGDVRLRLDIGDDDSDMGNSRQVIGPPAVVQSGRVLRFKYGVKSADADTDGVWVQTGGSNLVVFEPHAGQKVVSAVTAAPADLTKAGLPTAGDTLHKVDGSRTSVAGPTVSQAVVNGATLTVTFDKALDPSVNKTELALYLSVKGAGTIHNANPNASQHPEAITVQGSTLRLTLGTPARAGETVTLTYDGILLQDTGGNRAPQFVDLAVTNNTPDEGGPSPVRATVVLDTLKVAFDGTLDLTSAPAGSAFRIDTHDANGDVRKIPGTGTAALSARIVTVILAGSVRAHERAYVYYTKPATNPLRSASAALGNPEVLSFEFFQAVVVGDAVAPTLVGGAVSQTESGKSKMVLTYDEALDESSVPAAGDFAVTVGSDAVTISDVAVAARNVLLALSRGAASDEKFAVTYSPGANPIRDKARNAAAPFDTTLTAKGSGAPTLQSASVYGVRLALTYDKPLDPGSLPAPEAFALHDPLYMGERDDYRVHVATVGVESSTAVLRLNDAVYPCDPDFTVTYEEPAASPLQSLDGTDADTLMYRPVTNERADRCGSSWLKRASTGSVILSAGRPFAQDLEPRSEWFTVTASGGSVTVTGAAFSPGDPHELKLTLSRDLAAGETVTVSYTRPEGESGLWDIDGNQLADVEDTPVDNDAPAVPAAPGAPTLARVSDTSVEATWTEPDANSPVTGYDVQYRRADAADWTDHRHEGTGTSVTIGGLAAGRSYEARVRARNAAGAGAWSEPGTGHTGPARFESAATPADGRGVTLAFTKDILNAGAGADYTVLVDGEVRQTGGVSREDETVDLRLAAPVRWGETVTVAYVQPSGGTVLRDADGLAIESFGPEAVANTVPRPENNAATGAPVIEGTARVGETLTASAADIEDADGLSGAVFAHQWLSDDADIAGATDTRYTLTDADEGAAIRVRVTFTDDAGYEETLLSAATEPVAPPLPPLTASFRDVPAEHEGRGKDFSFELRFSEDFGGRLDYRKLRDEALQATNARVTGAERVAQNQNRRWTITVRPRSSDSVTVTLAATTDCSAAGAICTPDGRPLSNSPTATVAGPSNRPATGAPVIEGTARVGETLTASTAEIEDPDGLTGAVFAHQWLSDGADIAGATDARYTLTDADEDAAIRVRVTFTDDAGNEETLVSAATEPVAARPNRPATGAPTISGTVRVGETLTASTEDIEDPDGLSGAVFAHQWLSDGADISGATDARYTLTDEDEGAAIRVRVTFTDDAGNDETLVSAPTEPVAPRLPPLTASFRDVPASHGGGGEEFSFELRFSEDFAGLSYRKLRDEALEATNGRVTGARRVTQDRNRRWTITVRPSSSDAVTVTLEATTDCSAAGAICTPDGRPLSNSVSATIDGPSPPEATGVKVSSDAGADDTYGLGDTIRVTVTFSEAVEVTGAPRLKIDMDPADWGEKWARYASGGGSKLTFAHVVVQPNQSTRGIAVLASTLELNGGTIRSAATGVDAELAHPGLGHDPKHKVDWQQSAGDAANASAARDSVVLAGQALTAVDGLTPDEGAAALFGERTLGAARQAALDRLGNRNGRYDLGDLLSWIERCRRGEARCGGTPAGSPPASDAALAGGAAAERRGNSRRRGRSPVRRKRRRAGRAGWPLAMLFAAATIWSCTGDLVGPTLVDAPPDPGYLTVEFAPPPGSRDIGVLIRLEGPGIETARASGPGLALYQSESSAPRQIIVAGSLRPGPLVRFRVPDRGQLPLYRVRVLEVTGEDYGLRDAAEYRAVITH